MLKKTILIGALATMAASAQAATVVGTFAAALAGVSSSTNGIREGSTLSNVGGFVTGSTSDLAVVPFGTTLNFATLTASNGNEVSFTSSFGSFIGTIQDLFAAPAPNAIVGFSAFGNFTPSGALTAFESGLGALTVSFTQTGGLTTLNQQPAISGSFTFASESMGGGSGSSVPEPASWAMMIAGFGLVGAAMRRRAVRSVAA